MTQTTADHAYCAHANHRGISPRLRPPPNLARQLGRLRRRSSWGSASPPSLCSLCGSRIADSDPGSARLGIADRKRALGIQARSPRGPDDPGGAVIDPTKIDLTQSMQDLALGRRPIHPMLAELRELHAEQNRQAARVIKELIGIRADLRPRLDALAQS